MMITRMQKLMFVLCNSVLWLSQDMRAVIIVTYKRQSELYQWQTDFSLGSARIDPILDMWDDDFTRQGPFGNLVGKPTGTFEKANTSYLVPDDTSDYEKYYNETISRPTDPADFRPNNFNLESGESFLLSDLPSDFYITTDLYKPDPQLVSQVEYLIDGRQIFPGQRLALTANSFIFQMITKKGFTWGGVTDTQSSYGYKIVCPAGMRVELDVTELSGFSSTTVSASTHGCQGINLAVKGG